MVPASRTIRRGLTAAAWAAFRKPRRAWQASLYLEGARRVASWSDWLNYRAEEWTLELEGLAAELERVRAISAQSGHA